MSEMMMESRISAVEQNVERIRKDVELVQKEVSDVSEIEGEHGDVSQELVDCRKRIYAMEQSLLREDTLSAEERCLINMYRFMVKHPDIRRRMVVTSDGDMQMGHE